MIVMWLSLAVQWVCLQFVIVVFPGHAYYFYVLEVRCYNYQETHFCQAKMFFHIGCIMLSIIRFLNKFWLRK